MKRREKGGERGERRVTWVDMVDKGEKEMKKNGSRRKEKKKMKTKMRN